MEDNFNAEIPARSDTINGVPREDIIYALRDAGLENKAALFSDCHVNLTAYECVDCGYNHYLPVRCNLRICPDCGKSKHREYVERLKAGISRIEKPKHYNFKIYTLTSPKIGLDAWDKNVYIELQKWYKNFLKHPFIKDRINGNVGGGLYAIETKYSKAGDVYFHHLEPAKEYVYNLTGFHIHIHGIMLSKYFKQKKEHEFSTAWADASKGKATYAFVAKLGKLGYGLSEVTKYYFKPSLLGGPENYVKYLMVTKGLRLSSRWGCFYKMNIKKPKKEMVCAVCSGSLNRLGLIDREDALIEYEGSELLNVSSKGSFYQYSGKAKPVKPNFKDVSTFTSSQLIEQATMLEAAEGSRKASFT